MTEVVGAGELPPALRSRLAGLGVDPTGDAWSMPRGPVQVSSWSPAFALVMAVLVTVVLLDAGGAATWVGVGLLVVLAGVTALVQARRRGPGVLVGEGWVARRGWGGWRVLTPGPALRIDWLVTTGWSAMLLRCRWTRIRVGSRGLDAEAMDGVRRFAHAGLAAGARLSHRARQELGLAATGRRRGIRGERGKGPA